MYTGADLQLGATSATTLVSDFQRSIAPTDNAELQVGFALTTPAKKPSFNLDSNREEAPTKENWWTREQLDRVERYVFFFSFMFVVPKGEALHIW